MSDDDSLIGQTFTRDGGHFTVVGRYSPGMYECRSARGDIVIPAREIRLHQAIEILKEEDE